jgi:hypothetical protein
MLSCKPVSEKQSTTVTVVLRILVINKVAVVRGSVFLKKKA